MQSIGFDDSWSSEQRANSGIVAVSFHQYVDRLAECGLLTKEEVRSHLAPLPEHARPTTADALARWLVRQGLLTTFQASAVIQGKTKGLVLGNYVILHRLGSGGMGQVFKAQHRRMKRIVAIKVLPTAVAKKPELIQRFSREVEAAAKLMHPNIVAAFDADEADGLHFLVMEYVSGRDLAALVREQGPLSVSLCLNCMVDAARALEYAHSHGVVHRDIKPSNLLLTRTDRQQGAGTDDSAAYTVKLLDLGLARIDEEAAAVATPSDLTGTGLVMGTVDYMSPEQAINTHTVDHRTDIYSLGMTMHFLLTGRAAYPGESVMQRLLAHRENPIPSLVEARQDVPFELDAIFRKMAAKRPGDRQQSVGEVADALEALRMGTPLPTSSSASAAPVISMATDDAALADFLRSMGSGPQGTGSTITPSTATQLSESGSAPLALVGGESSEIFLTMTEGSTAHTPVSSALLRRARPATTLDKKLMYGACAGALLLIAIGWWLLRHDGSGKPTPQAVAETSAGILTPPDGDDSSPGSGESPVAPVAADRDVALWVLRKGGTVRVSDGGGRAALLQAGQPLPDWSFYITHIEMGGLLERSPDDRLRINQLRDLRLLKHLGLSASGLVTDSWLASLAEFPDLTSLALVNTEITDKGLSDLARACPNLEVLLLDNTPIIGPGLVHLGSMKQLRRLGLSYTLIEDQYVSTLTSLGDLTQLDVRQTPLSKDSIEKLHSALPHGAIVSDYPARP